MAGDIGFSFNPSQQRDLRMDQQGGGGARGLSPQQAVKVLSLRVPERQSQGAIAPLPLLQSRGGAAAGAGGLDTLVAALMRAYGGAGMQQQAPMAGPQLPPLLPSGGGTGTTEGWMGHERDLNRPPEMPRAPIFDSPAQAPQQFSSPPPRVTPGDEFHRPELFPVGPTEQPTAPIDLSPAPEPLFDQAQLDRHSRIPEKWLGTSYDSLF